MKKEQIIHFFIFLLLGIFILFSACENGNGQKFVTVFIADKNFLIPISFNSSGDPKIDAKLIINNVAKVEVDKVEFSSNSFNIFLHDLPNVNFEFDSYMLYSCLFLSFFNTFDVEKVNFIYNSKLLILKGIEYSMYYQDYYKYPINDVFNLGDVRKGKYYLYRYLSEDGKNYFIPILVQNEYDLDFYFSKSVDKIKQNLPDVKLSTFDKFFEEKFKFYLWGYNNGTVLFRTNDLRSFLNFKFYDKTKFYFIFYNSGIEKVYFLYRFLFWDLNIKLSKPQQLYLNTYPINLE